MAIIVAYHVIADMFPVGAVATKAGMPVKFASGLVVPTTATNALGQVCIGVAGDASGTTGPNSAYSTTLHTGAATYNTITEAWGSQSTVTQNRVSDFYNETSASGKITVYHGGGKFYVSSDVVEDTTYAAGDLVTSDANGLWNKTNATAANAVAIAAGPLAAYSSGVPGTETVDNSMSLGNYLPIILKV